VTNLCEFLGTLSQAGHELDIIYSTHLGSILEVSGSLFVDGDAKVRAAARRLLKLVTSNSCVKANDVSAFFSLLIARLCCAMTHLHEDIRLVCMTDCEFFPDIIMYSKWKHWLHFIFCLILLMIIV
jgi:hypothetical protein